MEVRNHGIEQMSRDIRRCRFIAPIADVSAFRGFHDTRLYLLKCIVGLAGFPIFLIIV
jgi:hypothetical protein